MPTKEEKIEVAILLEQAYRKGWNDAMEDAYPDVGPGFMAPTNPTEGWQLFNRHRTDKYASS